MKKFNILIAVILFFLNASVLASDFKIAYIDVPKIFAKSKSALALQKVMKDKFSSEQNSLQVMNNNLVALNNQLVTLKKKQDSGAAIAKAEKVKFQTLSEKFQKDQITFQQNYQIFQQKFQKYQDLASSLIFGKVNDILKKLNDKENYDLVLTSNQLVLVKPKYDITDQVIAELDKVDNNDLIKSLNDADKNQSNSNVLNNLSKPS